MSSVVYGVLLGVLAAALALGVGHLVASLTGPATSPLIAVGSTVIDAAPQAAKAFAIDAFGTNDKPVLLGGIGLVLIVIAGLVGVLALRSTIAGLLAIGAFGIVGALAALARPLAQPSDALPALVGGLAAMIALAWLVTAVPGREART